MATPPKKKSSVSPRKKRTVQSSGTKKTAAKRTTKKGTNRRSSRNQKKRVKKRGRLFFLLIVIVMASLVGVGYCLGSCWLKEVPQQKIEKKKHQPHHTVKKEGKVDTLRKVKRKVPVKKAVEVKKKHPAPVVKEQKRSYRSKLAYRGEKPRLVIIIDDVHTIKQLHAIQTLPIPVNPSIFPPYSLAPHTARLATQAVHYMIHLPMESGNAKFDRQSKTLKSGFSRAQMQARMKELRRLFPRAHYINNHTGSKFTSNAHAMRLLYEVMKEEGFTFIDSRTTGRSKVGQIAHAFGDDYVARDIFLDNTKSVSAIHAQLKKAVRLAKKHGYAIAIGHPHRVTMQALASAKPLLKEVEVVYIDEIFREE